MDTDHKSIKKGAANMQPLFAFYSVEFILLQVPDPLRQLFSLASWLCLS
jgi:hypothetical protein